MLGRLTDTIARSWRAEPLGSPLLIAALVTWIAVWIQTVGALAARDPALAWPARIGLLAFMAAFLLTICSDRPGRRRLHDVALAGQLAAVFGLLALGPSGSSGILLILFAATFTLRWPLRIELLVLAAVNGALFALMTFHWGMPRGAALTTTIAWAGFQAFAVLTVRYAMRAERMAAELSTVNAGLLATRSLLDETARDQERLRLSRELHDVAGHKLTALKLNLRALAHEPGLADREELRTSARLADELLDELRALVRQLRVSDGLDLQQALVRLAEPLPRPAVEFSIAPEARVPRAEQAEALLRVAQEALTNAARHGGARRAWLSLRREGDDVVLAVEDDGRVDWPLQPGNGLTGMQERIGALGGSLEAAPASRGGLRLAVRLPLETPP
ncbi:MAG TPA: sensor histidine kinase [Gammaproteobacteria bacterium]|nr:sensor histidine kinase [Gammaproteobacteria bacterium]